MNILEVSSLTKIFRPPRWRGRAPAVTAVNNISFTLGEGEILGLLGPNGAGKTTTLQMLLGVLTPTDGKIEYFKKDLAAHRSEILEQINFSSTYVGLPELLTVEENLTYISYLYHITNRHARREKIIDIFNLAPLLNKRFGSLSAGQKTRVGLAKAFINLPRVLLLDEPTASLDPDVAEYVREFLLLERKKFNVSIIITSHNMAEVEEICDRVIFIDQGKIVANDTPLNLSRSIELCHLELRAVEPSRLAAVCASQNLPYRLHGGQTIIDIPEQAIANFLQLLGAQNIVYTEIAIAKPSLEDYFLQVVKKN